MAALPVEPVDAGEQLVLQGPLRSRRPGDTLWRVRDGYLSNRRLFVLDGEGFAVHVFLRDLHSAALKRTMMGPRLSVQLSSGAEIELIPEGGDEVALGRAWANKLNELIAVSRFQRG